ncbi:kinase-like domain-containing protein [Xylaria cf. heliscus]|nr:kinase-like domain-containing protein [Xylaria cf. heliscus]
MDTLRAVASAIAEKISPKLRMRDPLKIKIDIQDIPQVRYVRQVATGGFNSVWLVRLYRPLRVGQSVDESCPPATSETIRQSTDTDSSVVRRFILRLPCEDSLLPYQVTNDVAFKRFVAKRLPHIPVPQVYLYQATDDASTSFIVEEYINCPPISGTWMALTPPQKENLAQQLAKILVDLAEVEFDMIGGLDPTDFSSAPTVEGYKLFMGRGKFHRNEYYPIGPYRSTKEYILSCYDREICYYTNRRNEDMDDEDLVADVPMLDDFIQQLHSRKKDLAETEMVDEPFVLIHGDFHGRNVLARGDQITAVIDWDFAGSYPLSEALTYGDVEVVNMISQKEFDENSLWGPKIRALIKDEVVRRNWDPSRIDLLMGERNPELARARTEMVPE